MKKLFLLFGLLFCSMPSVRAMEAIIKSLFVKKEVVLSELDEKLYKAILDKDTEKALQYIEQGARVTIVYSQGFTPLVFAASKGLVEVCARLIKGGADVDFRGSELNCPLITACEKGHGNVAALLINSGANVNIVDSINKVWTTPLLEATGRRLVRLCLLLLEKGANPNVGNVFEIAITRNLTPVCRMLIKKGVKIESHFLAYAAKLGKRRICRLLIDNNAKLKDNNALFHAAGSGFHNICKVLIKGGSNVNSSFTSFSYAYISLRYDRWSQPLRLAVYSSHFEVCKLLIENGARPDAHSLIDIATTRSALEKSHLDICKLLIKKGVNVNIIDEDDTTPLIYAARWGRSNLCTLLLEGGAKVGIEDYKGKTALCYAVMRNRLCVCEAIMTHTIVVPIPINVSESSERVFTALLCFKRLKIHKDVHRMILRSIGDLRKDLLQILFLQIKKGKRIPNVYIDIAADEIVQNSKVYLGLLMGKVFKCAKTDEMREYVNPDLLELNFGDKIYENVMKALRENKACLRVRHDEKEGKTCVVQ